MSLDRKFWTSIALGAVGLWVSTLRFEGVLESTPITLHWGIALPLLVALMYGARYGLLSGLIGLGGFFPFLLWPENGYANIASVVGYLFLYGCIGYFADVRRQYPAWWNHIVFISLASALLWSLLIFFSYPPLLALNPPFWSATASATMSQDALQAIAKNGFVNIFAAVMAVAALHKTNMVRRIFGVPTISWTHRNEIILTLCFAAGALFWGVYILFISIFVTETFPFIVDILHSPTAGMAALVFFIVSSMSAVILMEYNEKQLKLQEINTLALQELNHYKNNLEKRVEERTAELRTVNASLESSIAHLNAARNQVAQSEKLAALGSLVAGVAHELNTPIGNAVTVSSTLNEACEEFRQKTQTGLTRTVLNDFVSSVDEAGTMLMRNLERAAELVSSFKKVAVDQSSLQRQSVSLSEVLLEVKLVMTPSLRQSGVLIQIDCDPAIHMDSYPGALTQALMILINNATTHAFDGCKEPRITITVNQKGNDLIVLTVADNGQGVSPNVVNRIFEPFYTTKLGKGGSGLGMHIFYNLVTVSLGGTTWVESTLGEGVAVYLELPVSAPEISHQNTTELR